jgi:uncharacterized ion transporter superfamily protein YfcC
MAQILPIVKDLSKNLRGLALAQVRFDQCVKFIVPLMGVFLVVILTMLLLGVTL